MRLIGGIVILYISFGLGCDLPSPPTAVEIATPKDPASPKVRGSADDLTERVLRSQRKAQAVLKATDDPEERAAMLDAMFPKAESRKSRIHSLPNDSKDSVTKTATLPDASEDK